MWFARGGAEPVALRAAAKSPDEEVLAAALGRVGWFSPPQFSWASKRGSARCGRPSTTLVVHAQRQEDCENHSQKIYVDSSFRRFPVQILGPLVSPTGEAIGSRSPGKED